MTRLDDAIAELAEYNDDPAAGGMTREVYTPTYAAALDRVAGWMEEVGLAVRLDAVGNLFGRWEGTEPAAPRVLTGSHVDTTLNAGRYDGVVGVLGAIEAVRLLRARGRRAAPAGRAGGLGGGGAALRHGLRRQPRRRGRALPRRPRRAARPRRASRWRRRCATAGFDPDRLAEAELDPATVHALVELHIEQGAVLEASGDEIGVVTAIAAPHDFTLVLRGAATHAGATPMGLRRDALAGAAEVVLVVERLARAARRAGRPSAPWASCGRGPGRSTSCPGEVALDVDVRDSDARGPGRGRRGHPRRGARGGGAIAASGSRCVPIVEDVPVACADEVVAAVEAAAAAAGARARRMISGAYHDAMILGARVPIGMIFVPSGTAISHHPDEFTASEDLDRGVRVLAGALERLAA